MESAYRQYFHYYDVKKPEIISTSKQTRNSIISSTLWKIQKLLDATRILLNDVKEEVDGDFQITTGDPNIPAGLYTFAVEEFGKFLYLRSLEPTNGRYQIDYKNEFTNHIRKFERALTELPNECRLIHEGEKDSEFYETDLYDDIVANFETRLRVFYSDFDPRFANKVTRTEPPVSAKLLIIATEKLWDITNSLQIEHRKNRHNL